jgi:dienelactone hydrolase
MAIEDRMTPGRWCGSLLAALALILPATGNTQVARMEVHPFASTTLTDQEFLSGQGAGQPVTLGGELRLPRPGSDKLPAVVLLHGSGGVSGYVIDWEHDLNAMGVATFVIDSFTARGIHRTDFDQSQLGRLAMIVDAYRALDLLAKHPRIDPTRIALMGFSRGGQAALYAGLKRFQRMHGTPGMEFAAYIPFYGSCGTTFREDEDMADRPVRIFHGTADEMVPIEPCRAYVARLRAKGKDVLLTEYEGAGHVFDWQTLRKPVRLEKAQSTRRCELVEADDGMVVNAKTRQPFTYADACVELGGSIAYDEPASKAVRQAVREIVDTVLKVQ